MPWRERRPSAARRAGDFWPAAGLSLSAAARLQEWRAAERHHVADRAIARARGHAGACALLLAKALAGSAAAARAGGCRSARLEGDELDRLHELPPEQLSGRQHPAAARRSAQGLSAADHARLPHQEARQQSRHDRSHAGDLGAGHRRLRGPSGRALRQAESPHSVASLARTSLVAARSAARMPPLSLMARSAPRASRAATTAAWPRSAAIIKAVRP